MGTMQHLEGPQLNKVAHCALNSLAEAQVGDSGGGITFNLLPLQFICQLLPMIIMWAFCLVKYTMYETVSISNDLEVQRNCDAFQTFT